MRWRVCLGSQVTREKIALPLFPCMMRGYIADALDETAEAVELISAKGPLPIGSFYDIKDLLHRAKKGGTLSMRELLLRTL